jgi:hypothetical protein
MGPLILVVMRVVDHVRLDPTRPPTECRVTLGTPHLIAVSCDREVFENEPFVSVNGPSIINSLTEWFHYDGGSKTVFVGCRVDAFLSGKNSWYFFKMLTRYIDSMTVPIILRIAAKYGVVPSFTGGHRDCET